MKLIEWWQKAGAKTAWLSSDLRAELSGDTEVSIDALAPDLREFASALLNCQKTDYSHALERLNAHAFTDEFNGLASLLKARVYAQAGDFKNAGVELENAKNLSADPRIVAEVELLLSQDLDLADDVLENRGLCECEEWQRVLGDTCSFLPRDIQSQIRDKISTVSWLSDGGIVAMLCIVLDIKQREYPSALKLIEEAYPQSLSKGHLFLLRARVHHALDEFDEMLLCLKGAAELCDDVDMCQEVLDELSANAMARFEEKRADGIRKNIPTALRAESESFGKGSCPNLETRLSFEDWRSRLKNLKVAEENSVTVFCAVWHKDPNRWKLMEEHFDCLMQQTAPPDDVIYVLDGSDRLPNHLHHLNRFVVHIEEQLSIYQAWSVAIGFADTPLVMNLNLDDRLFATGLERLKDTLVTNGLDLIGGDWLISFDEKTRDRYLSQPELISSLGQIAIVDQWPPVEKVVPQKLGVGTVRNGTYGPSCLFRRLEEITYPWKFRNDEPIKSIGDAVFWDYLRKRGYKLGKITNLIGVYNSAPSTQAEFRENSDRVYLARGIAPDFAVYQFVTKNTVDPDVLMHISSQLGAFYSNGDAVRKFASAKNRWLSPPGLIGLIRSKKTSGTCHIVASGPTAPKCMDYVSAKHDFFTVNFGALNRVPSIFHFIETGSYSPKINPKREVRTGLLLAELMGAPHMNNALIAFKNLWMGCLDPEFLESRYDSKEWCAVPDLLFPGLLSLQRQKRLKEIVHLGFDFSYNSEFFLQIHTTTLTALQVAFFADYKSIVFHGFDGGGGTFYQEDFDFAGLLNPLEAQHIIAPQASGKHSVGGPALELMPTIRDHLLGLGVECFCGSSDSPLKDHLPVFSGGE